MQDSPFDFEEEYKWDKLMDYYRARAYEAHTMSEPDDSTVDVIAHCDWCREPIYDTDSYFHDTANLYFCLECLKEGFHKGKGEIA